MAFFPKLMLSPYHRWKELENRKIEMFQQWCPVGKNWFFWRKRLYQDDIFGWRRRLLDWINRWGDWRKLEMVWRKHSRRISKVASKPANWHYFAELWWNKNGIVSAGEFRCRVARSQLWRTQRVHLWKIKFLGSFSLYFGYLSLSCNSLLTCVFICSSNLVPLYFLLLRELISVMTKNTCWNTKGH